MKNNYFKRMVVATFIIVLCIPTVSSAQQYTTHTQATQIAYLYTIIAQLQTQLAILQASQGGGYYTPSFDSSDRLTAVTQDAKVRSGEVELEGQIDFDVRDSARAWFEYGTGRDVRQSTQSIDITGSANSSKSVSLPASVIRSNTTYFYRLVAEDSRGDYSEGALRSFTVSRYSSDYDDDDDDRDEDTPDVRTEDADAIDEDSARLRGEVDMNDFDNGLVFFLYGEDEDAIEDAEDEDEYHDISVRRDKIEKYIVDSSLDNKKSYTLRLINLEEDTDYYFRICAEYEDEDGDETLECGDVEEFAAE